MNVSSFTDVGDGITQTSSSERQYAAITSASWRAYRRTT